MGLRLTVNGGSLHGRVFELEQGYLTLGRHENCVLRFHHEHDPGVSSYHVIIEAGSGGFVLKDQHSTNGTFINGSPVQEAVLKNGDTIRLGREGPEIRVALGDAPPVPPPPPAYVPEATAPGDGLRHTITNLSYYNPQKSKRESHIVGIGIAVVIAGVIFLINAVIFISSMGFAGAFIGCVMAFTPAPFYIILYLWMDRYDPEPAWALSAAFGWGALVSLLVSFVINTLFGGIAAALIDPQTGDTLAAVISAPLVEEGTKGLGVVLALIFFRKEFDGVLDGLVYAGIVALGFATGENVLYYGRTFVSDGFSGLLFIGFLRGILSPFAHSLFTSMTGIGCGISRETHKAALRFLAPLLGYFGAVFLHSLWNTVASLLGPMFFVAYLLIWVPLFLAFLGLIIALAVRERRIIRNMLGFEVAAGTITQQELDLVSSIGARFRWLSQAFSDRAKFNARRKYLRAITKLGFCYWHVSRANAANHQTISLPQIPKFKSEIISLRNQV